MHSCTYGKSVAPDQWPQSYSAFGLIPQPPKGAAARLAPQNRSSFTKACNAAGNESNPAKLAEVKKSSYVVPECRTNR